jgi:hypothetical protein
VRFRSFFRLRRPDLRTLLINNHHNNNNSDNINNINQQRQGLEMRSMRNQGGARDADVSRAPGMFFLTLFWTILIFLHSMLLYLSTASLRLRATTQTPTESRAPPHPYVAPLTTTSLCSTTRRRKGFETHVSNRTSPHHHHIAYKRHERGSRHMSRAPCTFPLTTTSLCSTTRRRKGFETSCLEPHQENHFGPEDFPG